MSYGRVVAAAIDERKTRTSRIAAESAARRRSAVDWVRAELPERCGESDVVAWYATAALRLRDRQRNHGGPVPTPALVIAAVAERFPFLLDDISELPRPEETAA